MKRYSSVTDYEFAKGDVKWEWLNCWRRFQGIRSSILSFIPTPNPFRALGITFNKKIYCIQLNNFTPTFKVHFAASVYNIYNFKVCSF